MNGSASRAPAFPVMSHAAEELPATIRLDIVGAEQDLFTHSDSLDTRPR